MDDPPHDTNRLRTLLTACLVLLLVTSGSVAVMAGHEFGHYSFEESSINDKWDVLDTAQEEFGVTTERATDGSQSYNSHSIDGTEDDSHIRTNDTGVIESGSSYSFEADVFPTDGAQNGRILIGLRDAGGDDVYFWFNNNFNQNVGVHGSTITNTDTPHNGQDADPVMTWGEWSEINVTANSTDVALTINGEDVVVADQTGNLDPDTTHIFIEGIDNQAGQPSLDFFVDDIQVSSGPGPPETDLELDIAEYMQYASSQTYTVTFVEDDVRTDVTEHANTTVVSSNTSIVTVSEPDTTLTATNNENVSGVATITANFTDDAGTTHEVTENVTVAQATMKNFDILPSSWRINALFAWDMGTGDQASDTLPLIILMAIFAGGITARVVSSFAGIGAMLLVIIVGWFGGWVGEGVVLSALFVGLFIGFNLAANIDYAVRR